jgi:RNA polymerase sigma factor (sigma-70 family)
MQLSLTRNLDPLLLEEEKSMLLQLSRSDFSSFWHFWQKNRQFFYYYCKNWMGGNPIEAEEVLSEVMLKAWEKLPHYAHQITNLKAWLTRLTHNHCIDIQRKRKKRGSNLENIDSIDFNSTQVLQQVYDSPESTLLNHELLNYLNTAIAALPTRLGEPFKLRCYQNLSYREIAQKLNISEDAVGKNLQEARQILQKRVKTYLSGQDTSVIGEFSAKSFETKVPEIPTITLDYQVTALCMPTQLQAWF